MTDEDAAADEARDRRGFDLTVERRRQIFMVLAAVAALAFLFALVPTLLALPSAPSYLVIAVVVLAVDIIVMLVVLLYGETEEFDEDAVWTEEEERYQEPEPEGQELLLRCKHCGEVFPVLDDGSRPLRHTCPNCGTSGILRNLPEPSGTS